MEKETESKIEMGVITYSAIPGDTIQDVAQMMAEMVCKYQKPGLIIFNEQAIPVDRPRTIGEIRNGILNCYDYLTSPKDGE